MVWSNSFDWPPRNTKTTNDVDDDDAGATVTMNVVTAINIDSATATVEDDEGNHPWW